jgi:hypothetical protein
VNNPPRPGQLPIGPLVAALGAVLVIVSLFLDWYDTITGFTVFEALDLLLVLLAVAAIGSLVASMGLVRAAIPPGVPLGVALFTVFVVLTQIINDPPAVVGPGPDKDIGIWLALAGSALMVAGAVLGYAQISLAVEPRAREADSHEAETATAPAGPGRTAPAGYAAPGERAVPGPEPSEPGRPAPSDDPTRPLADPDAPPPPRSDRL